MFRRGDGAFSERGSVYRPLSRFLLPLDLEATPAGACVAAATVAALSILLAGGARAATDAPPTQALVTAAAETTPVPHHGDAADDSAIWRHPSRPSLSTIIGTDKLGGVVVYDLSGRQLHYYADSQPNNVDLRDGFLLGGRRVTLVLTSDRRADAIRIYRVDPATRGLERIGEPVATGFGIAGLCMYRSRASGTFYVFVTDSSGTVQQWELTRVARGMVGARKVRTLRLTSAAEGCVADDRLGRLYVAEEEVGIWRYGADPHDGTHATRIDSVGSGRLTADIEGLAIYERTGTGGYLVVSSQGSDSFAMYQRAGANRYLTSFAVGRGQIDAVSHTDGIEVTSRALGPVFPQGVFVAQDDRDESGRQNFKLVPWDRIARRVEAARPNGRFPRVGDRAAPRAAADRLTRRTPRRFYLDSIRGNDARSGTSPAAAWRSLRRLSAASVGPGDELLLRRGGRWSGTLRVEGSGTTTRRLVVDAYGTGALPVVVGGTTCVILAGSHLTLRHLHVRGCSWAGVDVRGTGNTIERSVVSGSSAGVYVRNTASRTRILHNRIVDNNRMTVLTPEPGSDDSGAFGILIHGQRTEVAYNMIRGSDAFSHDYGRDGAAIEIYGGRDNVIHHNLAIDNDAFVELGRSGSSDNTIAYNVVRSKLPTSVFAVTRGAGSRYGPVKRTTLVHNTVFMTGGSSQGFVCHDGCGPDILRMRNNIVAAVWKVGYADAPFDEDYNLFWGGRVQFVRGANSLLADPRHVRATAGDFRLRPTSPAIDRGTNLGYKRDFANQATPADGDGDGRPLPDLGAFEHPGLRRR